MEPSLSKLEARARRAYERARVWRALAGAGPLAVLVVVAALVGSQPAVALAVGSVLVAAGVVSLWFGHGLPRGLGAGVLTGLLPLVAVTCAAQYGHTCAGAKCYSVCLTASVVGGAAAGLVYGAWVVRRTAPAGVAALGASAALLTGSMGCSCTGAAGIVALAVGFLACVPFLVVRAVRA